LTGIVAVETAVENLKSRAEISVSIVIPAYGAADQLRRCLESLVGCCPPGCGVIVADDATPDDSVSEVARSFGSTLPVSYVRRKDNLGFVENCNEAMRSVLPSGDDVLLLNSDTRVTPGFLEEMWQVLHLHEKHGVVTPRSNNATIFSVPVSERLAPDDAYELWCSIRDLLPRYQVMPTAVGFCMLIKNVVLRQLGVFDPVYSPGYNEENDFVCRINRRGYSAISANHAFVFHDESSSFGARRAALDKRNREVLNARYPEYPRKIADYVRSGVDPVEHFAILWRAHRPTVLYDLSHLPAKHSGTSDFALNLLLHLAPRLEPACDVWVGVSDAARTFFAQELTGYRFFDEKRQAAARFDLVFKPAHIFTWPELSRMVRLGGRLAFTQLDIIAARCEHLSDPRLRILFRTAAVLADRVVTISEFSRVDFATFYQVPVPIDVIHLGTHEDPEVTESRSGYVLIVGNAFDHKGVHQAIAELRGVADIVALGGDQQPEPGVRWLSSGSLSRSTISDLYERAGVVVYPSFYEGFGLPILDAVGRGIPVVALDMAVNRELRQLTGDALLTLVSDHRGMRAAVSNLLKARPVDQPVRRVRHWSDVGADYQRTVDELLRHPINLDLLRRRWELLTTIDAVHPLF
jgi:GT2 family glycosyltransferase